jgi:2-phospho-L-lactate guanylyltransferase
MPDDDTWAVVVPVKPLVSAKSRLVELGRSQRRDLALAMLLDTVAAALAARRVAEVLVVTDDATVATEALAAGAKVVTDEPNAGLNEAFSHGIRLVMRERAGAPIALLAGDLPALRATELDLALESNDPAAVVTVVADADGIGTTLLASRTPTTLRPAFGEDSFAAHRRAGARPVETSDVPGLRRDVDALADLLAAIELGVGAATSAVLAQLDVESLRRAASAG